ncbi:MAG: hypothetical protein WDZ35_06515 [Crocinitomicaceae bacterium]
MNKEKSVTVETSISTITLLEDGILENIVHDGCTVTAENLKEIKAANLQLMGEQPYCVLIVSGMMSDISTEARELAASAEFVQNTIAKALLVNSLGHRLVGQFYIKINRPCIKTKLFTDKTKAMMWLRKQLSDHKRFS